jgi:hypothetical protein
MLRQWLKGWLREPFPDKPWDALVMWPASFGSAAGTFLKDAR